MKCTKTHWNGITHCEKWKEDTPRTCKNVVFWKNSCVFKSRVPYYFNIKAQTFQHYCIILPKISESLKKWSTLTYMVEIKSPTVCQECIEFLRSYQTPIFSQILLNSRFFHTKKYTARDLFYVFSVKFDFCFQNMLFTET